MSSPKGNRSSLMFSHTSNTPHASGARGYHFSPFGARGVISVVSRRAPALFLEKCSQCPGLIVIYVGDDQHATALFYGLDEEVGQLFIVEIGQPVVDSSLGLASPTGVDSAGTPAGCTSPTSSATSP